VANYWRVADEDGQVWLVQRGDPLWERLAPLQQLRYKLPQVILPRELALFLHMEKPNYDRSSLLIEEEASLEDIGRAVLIEDIRQVLST